MKTVPLSEETCRAFLARGDGGGALRFIAQVLDLGAPFVVTRTEKTTELIGLPKDDKAPVPENTSVAVCCPEILLCYRLAGIKAGRFGGCVTASFPVRAPGLAGAVDRLLGILADPAAYVSGRCKPGQRVVFAKALHRQAQATGASRSLREIRVLPVNPVAIAL